MKRIIKSIVASTLKHDGKYLIGDPEDKDELIRDYRHLLVPFDEVIEDMVSDIKTEDLIIRVLDTRLKKAYYLLASKQRKNFDSCYDVFYDVTDGLPIKERPEYDAESKTIYTTYGDSWSYAIDCAELPDGVHDSWLKQAYDLYDNEYWEDWECLDDILREHPEYANKLNPNPADLF